MRKQDDKRQQKLEEKTYIEKFRTDNRKNKRKYKVAFYT